MKRTVYIFGLALFFLITASLYTYSQSLFAEKCDREDLGKLFSRKKIEQKKTPVWKIIESNLSQEIKICILEKIKKIKGIKNLNDKQLLYFRQKYTMISDGVVDAIASNFGYAAVYASTNTGLIEKKRVDHKRLIKISFSIEFDGTVNVHNIFQILSVNNHITFFEHFDKQVIEKSNECLHCHRRSSQPLKMLGRYRAPLIRTHLQIR